LALLEWAKNFHEVSDTMATAWQLPKPEIATIGTLTTNFGVQLDKCHNDQATHSDFVEKNTMRKALMAKIRDFYNANVRFNKLIDDAGRARMPYGYNGAVISSLVSDTPITDPKLLTNEELASTSHHILKFTAAARKVPCAVVVKNPSLKH
jgi:hypothetical protein